MHSEDSPRAPRLLLLLEMVRLWTSSNFTENTLETKLIWPGQSFRSAGESQALTN